MIQAVAELTQGGHLVILGLSDENMRRLEHGLPIKADLAKMGLPPIEIIMFNDRSEDTIMEKMINAGWLSKDTKINKMDGVHGDP